MNSKQSTINHDSQLLVNIDKRGFLNSRLFDMQGLVSGLLALGIVAVDGCIRPPPRPPPPRPGRYCFVAKRRKKSLPCNFSEL